MKASYKSSRTPCARSSTTSAPPPRTPAGTSSAGRRGPPCSIATCPEAPPPRPGQAVTCGTQAHPSHRKPLVPLPNTPSLSACAAGTEEGARAAFSDRKRNSLNAPRGGGDKAAPRVISAEAECSSAPRPPPPSSARRTSGAQAGRGHAEPQDAGAVSQQHSAAQHQPMGKSAGPLFESKPSAAPARPVGDDLGRAGGPGPVFRLRIRRRSPLGSSARLPGGASVCGGASGAALWLGVPLGKRDGASGPERGGAWRQPKFPQKNSQDYFFPQSLAGTS